MCKLLGIHREDLITDNLAREEEIATFVGGLQADVDDTFKKKLISILARLDEKEWDLLEKIAEDIVNAKEEKE